MALIKCTKCGQMISDKAKACPKCGEPVRGFNETPNEYRRSEQPFPRQNNSIGQTRKKKTSPALITTIALLSLAVLALGGFVFYKMVYEPSQLDQEVLVDMSDDDPVDTTVVVEEQPVTIQEESPVAIEEPVDAAADNVHDDALTRYVVVTGVNVRLRTSPEINDYNVITDRRGKNLHPNKGDRLECVGEYDDFYLVIFKGREVYISKQFSYLLEE